MIRELSALNFHVKESAKHSPLSFTIGDNSGVNI
jgi:hypothetical protein